MFNYRNAPKKGIYDITEGGAKTFNNPDQDVQASNSMKQEQNDQFCKDRYIFATFTSLEADQSMKVKAAAKSFQSYPVLPTYDITSESGASSLIWSVGTIAALSVLSL